MCCIPGDECQSVFERSCCEKSIDRRKRLLEAETAPAVANRQRHGEDPATVLALEFAEPPVQRLSSALVSSTNQLDPSTKLTHDQDAQKKLVGFTGVKPASNARVRPLPLPQLRDDVGIDQVTAHRSTGRSGACGRSNTSSSPTSGIRPR